MKSKEYAELKELLENHLLDYLPEVDDKSRNLYESMKYSLTAGGKRMRPVLALAGVQMCGEDVQIGLPYACAIEFIQTYSLIHDDLPCMDNDDLRRGKPTNHKVFGEDIALLAGDGLLSAAYEAMTKDMLMYLDNYEMLKRFSRACFEISKGTGIRGMVAGQVADIEHVSEVCTPEMLDYIHANKTAAFIESSVMAGAYLGGADKQMRQDLRTFGEALGIAFQIVDDIADSADEEGQNNYVTIHGMEASKEKAHELIDKARSAISLYGDAAVVYNDVLDFLEEQIA